MENTYNTILEFFKALPKVLETLLPYAKRSGISAEAALALAVISESSVTDNYFEQEIKSQLSDRGLIEYTENGLIVTGKGAILAKSLINVIEKCKY